MDRKVSAIYSTAASAETKRIADLLVIGLSGVAAWSMRSGEMTLNSQYAVAILMALVAASLLFPTQSLYVSWRGRSPWNEYRRLATAWALTLAVVIGLGAFSKTTAEYSRLWFAGWAALGLVGMISYRAVLRAALSRLRSMGVNVRRVLLVGDPGMSESVRRRLQAEPHNGFGLVGSVDAYSPDSDSNICTLESIEDFVIEGRVQEVWLTLALKDGAMLQQIVDQLRSCPVTLRLVPDLESLRLLECRTSSVVGMPVIELSATPLDEGGRIAKALFDIGVASTAIVALAPLLAAIAIAVKLSSRGPILFRQMRHGWDGQPIEVWKFRTMRVHQEDNGAVTQARPGDPRVTRLGSFLRRTSLDELPQFFNVLQGKLSIVGPRPHAVEHNEYYKNRLDRYMLRHRVKPGITGWAQVNGCRGETDTDEKMQARLEHDLFYIRNWSIWFDIRIFFRSLRVAFTDPNAY